MVREVIFLDLCTPCLKDSEEATRTEATWTGTVSINGGPPKQLDLCEDHHAKIIGGLPEALEQYGDKPSSNGQAVSPARDSYDRHVCPVCGKRYEYRNSLQAHTKKTHGNNLAQLEGKRTETYTCDLCSFVTNTPQGLGAHKRAIHGIKGNSKSTQYGDSRNATGQ